jgi:ribosomal protein S18 acetylase RimI-like enzyme
MAPLTYRALPLFVKVAELQRRFAPGPHYYLESIAVDPEAHGQRLASRLIRPFLERADTRSLPCYTETMAKGNVPIYEHFGFEVVDRYAPPEKGPRVWSMLRRPSSRPVKKKAVGTLKERRPHPSGDGWASPGLDAASLGSFR